MASASFVLVAEHHGRLPLYHIDLYRIEETAQVSDLGLEEYVYGAGVCAVEWADQAISLFPRERLEVYLDYAGERRRRLRFQGVGERYRGLLDALAVWVRSQ